MPNNSKEHTPYDQFNFEIPEQFPSEGISTRAAKAVVISETWTDANPILNLSSFVTTFREPDAKDIHDGPTKRSPGFAVLAEAFWGGILVPKPAACLHSEHALI